MSGVAIMRGSTAYNAVQLIRHGYTYSIAELYMLLHFGSVQACGE